MFIRQQFGRPRLLQNAGEKGCGQVRIEQKALLILGKDGMVPDLVVHGKADEPAKQEIVIELLHQQPVAADGVQDLQQQGPQQLLRGNRGPSLP